MALSFLMRRFCKWRKTLSIYCRFTWRAVKSGEVDQRGTWQKDASFLVFVSASGLPLLIRVEGGIARTACDHLLDEVERGLGTDRERGCRKKFCLFVWKFMHGPPIDRTRRTREALLTTVLAVPLATHERLHPRRRKQSACHRVTMLPHKH